MDFGDENGQEGERKGKTNYDEPQSFEAYEQRFGKYRRQKRRELAEIRNEQRTNQIKENIKNKLSQEDSQVIVESSEDVDENEQASDFDKIELNEPNNDFFLKYGPFSDPNSKIS